VFWDLLCLGDRSLLPAPFGERRAELEKVLAHATSPLHLTPSTQDPAVAQRWFDEFEGAGLDGLVVKDVEGTYRPGDRGWLKVKHLRTADCVIAGFREHKDGKGVGSLLLGLYDDDGVLHHVGVASSFAAKVRGELAAELEPYRKDALVDHPWADWATAAHEESDGQRRPGNLSRWNATKDLSWEPLRIERVCEVEFEGMMNGRFRHNARFRRWRPDKDPAECTYAQLETVPVSVPRSPCSRPTLRLRGRCAGRWA